MQSFQFNEFDAIGEETLEAMGRASNFNRWMYETIKPHCKGKILEIGSGAGNISGFFLDDNFNIMLTDIRENYCNKLRTKFNHNPFLLGIEKMNLTDPDFDARHKTLFDSFDTVFALNVVEHIENDSLAVENSRKLLKKGGHLIILVPSYSFLYNRFDHSLGHYRRYTTKSLSRLFYKNQLEIFHRQYFNFTGMLGWFFSGRVLNKKIIPVSQMKIFNQLVPLFKIIDSTLMHRAGLSTIVCGKKIV